MLVFLFTIPAFAGVPLHTVIASPALAERGNPLHLNIPEIGNSTIGSFQPMRTSLFDEGNTTSIGTQYDGTLSSSQLHLTGIHQVDFFSIRDMRIPLEEHDSIPQFSDMTETRSEKSPWIAGALSLALPGAGEVYAGNYLKGAIFFGIEVGVWLTAYLYDKKGDDQTTLFEAYANEHWNAVRYAKWTYDHAELLNSNVNRDLYDLLYDDNIEFVDPDTFYVPFDELNWEALHEFEEVIAYGVTNGYTHKLPYYGQQQYYELIGKYEQFYSGWDDAAIEVPPDHNFTVPENSRYKIYSRMRAEANNYYDVASTMVSVAIINHVLSALDAAWTAANYNKALHAQVNVRLQRTPYGVVPIKEAKVSWTF